MANYIQRKQDVFLSFRGEDTRHGFTSHLFSALCNAKVETFMDDSMERGEQISSSLQKAIEESKVSVIIFSQNYAGSRWCLDELVKIMKCKQEQQQIVVPVFYEIETSNVRHQMETYKDAFKKHEERYKEDKNKIRKWRETLTEAANLSGWSSRNIRDESQLVKAIVGDILSKLNRMSPIECSNMVGIDSRFKKVESLLCMEDSQSVRMVGIWGMWGSGKTAIAKAVFDRLHTQFEGYYFLANVKEELKRHDALDLRSRIVSSLLGEHNKINLNMPDSNIFVKDRLGRKRVLVVLDDVDDFMQLQNLLGGNHDKFGGGSRILITTRDRKVLRGHIADGEIYEVERLSHYQALELFSLSAFGQNHPPADYMDMSIKVVDYCDSNPLALKDLGSSLCKKTIEEWQSALRRQYLNPYIQTLIRSSYDGLSSEAKNVFLDIACFFRGEDRSRIVNVLESCYPSADFIISRLQDRSLVTTSGNKMEMSLLIQKLGLIVVHEAEPGKYSRLRNYDEVSLSLKTPKGKEAIESIFLDIPENELDLEADVFKEMDRLRLLKFFVANSDKDNKRRVKLPHGLHSLSDTLRYIHWHRFPLNSLPKSFSARHLVELILPFSKIKELGLGKQFDFESLPKSIGQLPKLQFLSLSNCKRLQSIKELPSSLEILQVDECSLLESLFTNRNLRRLNLANCFMLDMKTHNNIIEDALFIIHHVSSKSRKERHQVQFLFPGSEVPKFFYDRSQEISVTKQLPMDCEQFKGIAFCVAFGLHESSSMQLRNMIKRETEVFLCKFSIKVRQGDELKLIYDSQVSYEASLVRSDHLLIWYHPCTEPFDGGSIQESYWLKPYYGQGASFEFSVTTQKSHLFPIQLVVKGCGILLLQNCDGNH
ncbi:hypothetical protein K2173_008972 [Erythroxylum novogranatense]|uniref:TIR domain-containing protein n=1 Tax=Erythroxylum novogranatense TaxID=1862640 RepID=A0AAV8TVH0_9ROSI|nr:hypothetical protein K2173_008972 [Erythroxylum novogranatense]